MNKLYLDSLGIWWTFSLEWAKWIYHFKKSELTVLFADDKIWAFKQNVISSTMGLAA